MDDITVEHLETQKQRAAFCATVTLPSTQLAPLLDIAVRAAGTYACLIIKRLQKRLRGRDPHDSRSGAASVTPEQASSGRFESRATGEGLALACVGIPHQLSILRRKLIHVKAR